MGNTVVTCSWWLKTQEVMHDSPKHVPLLGIGVRDEVGSLSLSARA